ncbi:MAG: hypothetical protein WAV95_02590 [Azonexus sp.]
MDWLNLPAPESDRQPAFQDLASAKLWLGAQPKAQPLLMQSVLGEQLDALDAAQLPPALAVELLNLLHGAIIPVQASLEVRFTRKALPMPNEEERIFAAAQKLWTRLGIAYLRLAPHFAPREKCPLLFRAANAFRMAQFAHFQASRECPAQLDELLFSTLIQAADAGILRQPHSDSAFRHFGEANIAGLLAWAFLLRLVNPYHMTAAQLTVANRTISRWRELCNFQMDAEHAAPALDIPLAERFGARLPDSVPQYLNIQPVVRKIHARVVSLRAGETPESLKLGRELSGTACIRLLGDIEQRLRPPTKTLDRESGQIILAFGAEHAYAVFREELLNPEAPMDVQSDSLSNQRMALFGFDQVARMPTAVQRLKIPGEPWTLENGQAIRQPEAGPRRLAPCLISANRSERPQLGVLHALLGDASGTLTAKLEWYSGTVEACRLQQPGLRDTKLARVAVFLLNQDGQMSLVLPNNAPIRPGIGLALEGSTMHHLVPTEVVERGIDFVRYACRPG